MLNKIKEVVTKKPSKRKSTVKKTTSVSTTLTLYVDRGGGVTDEMTVILTSTDDLTLDSPQTLTDSELDDGSLIGSKIGLTGKFFVQSIGHNYVKQ